MNFFSKTLPLFLLCLLFSGSIFAQQSFKEDSAKRNSVRMSWMFTKGYLSYERLLARQLSAGVVGIADGGVFQGYGGNLFGRVYLSRFDRSAFFYELKGGYMYYTAEVFSSISYSGNEVQFYGKHMAAISSFSGTFSMGGNLYCTENFYLSLQMGYRLVSASFGSDDRYYQSSSLFGNHDKAVRLRNKFSDWNMPGSNMSVLFHMGVTF